MNPDRSRRQKMVRLRAVVILAVGFCCSLAIYLTAVEPAENPLVDQIENSKSYRRSLELYGGKANVLAEQFSRWFGSLWHGSNLAFTVAVITVLVAAAYYFIASPVSTDDE